MKKTCFWKKIVLLILAGSMAGSLYSMQNQINMSEEEQIRFFDELNLIKTKIQSFISNDFVVIDGSEKRYVKAVIDAMGHKKSIFDYQWEEIKQFIENYLPNFGVKKKVKSTFSSSRFIRFENPYISEFPENNQNNKKTIEMDCDSVDPFEEINLGITEFNQGLEKLAIKYHKDHKNFLKKAVSEFKNLARLFALMMREIAGGPNITKGNLLQQFVERAKIKPNDLKDGNGKICSELENEYIPSMKHCAETLGDSEPPSGRIFWKYNNFLKIQISGSHQRLNQCGCFAIVEIFLLPWITDVDVMLYALNSDEILELAEVVIKIIEKYRKINKNNNIASGVGELSNEEVAEFLSACSKHTKNSAVVPGVKPMYTNIIQNFVGDVKYQVIKNQVKNIPGKNFFLEDIDIRKTSGDAICRYKNGETQSFCMFFMKGWTRVGHIETIFVAPVNIGNKKILSMLVLEHSWFDSGPFGLSKKVKDRLKENEASLGNLALALVI